MTDFEEVVAYLEQERIGSLDMGNVKRYTMKARFGPTKDFYVDFTWRKCSMWHNELKGLDMAVIHSINLKDSDFKTHIDVQKELDKIP